MKNSTGAKLAGIVDEITEIEILKSQLLYAKFQNSLKVIANFKQIATNKAEFIKTEDYKEYINKKEDFENKVATTLIHEEFDKYTKLLENLQNPLEIYQRKLVALATKYDNYDATIKECNKKLEECIEGGLGDFEEITRYVDNGLVVSKKENIIMKFVNKILNKITKGSGFNKNVMEKMENELSELEQDITESVEIIDEQTVGIVAKIEEIRENINAEFKVAME